MTAFRANINVNMCRYKIRLETMYSITPTFASRFKAFPATTKARSSWTGASRLNQVSLSFPPHIIFALKDLRWFGFGFAAGCEAVALPRRRDAFYIFGLCPWCGLWPNKPQGHSPEINLAAVGGAQP